MGVAGYFGKRGERCTPFVIWFRRLFDPDIANLRSPFSSSGTLGSPLPEVICAGISLPGSAARRLFHKPEKLLPERIGLGPSRL